MAAALQGGLASRDDTVVEGGAGGDVAGGEEGSDEDGELPCSAGWHIIVPREGRGRQVAMGQTRRSWICWLGLLLFIPVLAGCGGKPAAEVSVMPTTPRAAMGWVLNPEGRTMADRVITGQARVRVGEESTVTDRTGLFIVVALREDETGVKAEHIADMYADLAPYELEKIVEQCIPVHAGTFPLVVEHEKRTVYEGTLLVTEQRPGEFSFVLETE
jgi:hypothetical protein